MENYVLEDIKEYAMKKLQLSYGYCGCADAPNMSMINSDDKRGNNIIIKIETKPE